MRRELWWLPQWWAEEEDIVWNGEEQLHLPDDTMILPWGWSPALCHQLKQAGVKASLLPSRKELEGIRQLSHRQTAVSLLQELQGELSLDGHLAGNAVLCRSIEEAEEAANAYGEALLKSPWSSSGRGLIRSAVTSRDVMVRQASAVIRSMGGIVGERWFDKKQDFAMLFRVGHSRVHFLGYSLFDNAENCTYRCGYLLSNQQIEEKIGVAELPVLAERLRCALDDLFRPFFGLPWQVGYIGVDMMKLRSSDDGLVPPVHPCVELNLRCTMGVVARLWSDLHLKDGQSGRFEISPMDASGHFRAQFLVG